MVLASWCHVQWLVVEVLVENLLVDSVASVVEVDVVVRHVES